MYPSGVLLGGALVALLERLGGILGRLEAPGVLVFGFRDPPPGDTGRPDPPIEPKSSP